MKAIQFLLSSKVNGLRRAALAFVPKGKSFGPSDSAIRVLCGGDICFDTEWRYPPGIVRTGKPLSFQTRVRRALKRRLSKYIFSPKFYSGEIDVDVNEIRLKTEELAKKLPPSFVYDSCTKLIAPPVPDRYDHPFNKISAFMRERDVVFANLENPLSDNKRVTGFFRSEPGYAEAIKKSGISIVSLANNHVFDAGEIGFMDTIRHLDEAGIEHVGDGNDLESARAGRTITVNGIKIHFLAYTQFCNSNFTSAANSCSGIMPLDLDLATEDIENARLKNDLVFVSLHWGYENQPNIHPKQIEIARNFIDAGADCIIGHHSHVPHGVEIYRERPILYSLGNFIFGYYKAAWGENILAEIAIEGKRISGVLIYPISGREEQMNPSILEGKDSERVLQEIRIKSAIFKTRMAIEGGIGYIRTQQ